MCRRQAGRGGRRAAVLGLCGALAALVVTACGGGGEGGAPATGPGLAPQLPSLPRIEPYERSSVVTDAMSLASPEPQPRSLALRPQGDEGAALQGPVPLVSLGPPDAAPASPAAGTLPAPGASSLRGTARSIGIARALDRTADPQALARLWSWSVTPAGGARAALRLRSEGALGVRVALQVGRLPAQAQVSVSGGVAGSERVSGAQVLAALERQPPERLYWLPPVAGPEVLLEIELPPGVDAREVEVSVPRLAHLWWTHAAAREGVRPKIGESGSCQADASCSPEYDAQARAVARLEFMRGDTAYLCTGTLMADVAASGLPYFLTAQHCVGDPVTASSVSTFWFYRASACNSQALDPAAVAVHGGAVLLSASIANDTTLLRLVGSPPRHAVHAGSLLAPVERGTTLASLHHPGGDLLKVSVGNFEGFARCDGTRCQQVAGDGDFLTLRWRQGSTESGSSGAPLFATVGSRRYVTGHLFAGSASCQQLDASDFFGRFDKAYPALRPWLGSVPGAPG